MMRVLRLYLMITIVLCIICHDDDGCNYNAPPCGHWYHQVCVCVCRRGT